MKKKLLFCLLVISITFIMSCSSKSEREIILPYDKELVAEINIFCTGNKEVEEILELYLYETESKVARAAYETFLRARVEEEKKRK